MTDLNCNDHLEPLIQQLEESLSSTEWRDFANPLNKSKVILKVISHLAKIYPTLRTSDNTLQENTKCVFENNLRSISNILQFCACHLPEDLHALRLKLEEFLPALKGVKDLETFDLTPDAESEGNITRHLSAITSITTTIQELLTFFKAAFFSCKYASTRFFNTSEFFKVSVGLKEILAMLEFKSLSTNVHAGGNRCLLVLFNVLDRPLKIAMRALWLLFTFPAIEDVNCNVILTLCRCAVQILVCAVDILMDLTWIFLKDLDALKGVRQELLEKFQKIRDYCGQMLEQEPSIDSINDELGGMNRAEISKTSPQTSTVDVKDTYRNEAEFSKTELTSGLKVTADGRDLRGKSGDVSEEVLETDGSEAIVVVEDMPCKSVEKVTISAEDTFCKNAEISKETRRMNATVDLNDAHVNSVDVSKELKETSAKPTVTVSNVPCNSAEITGRIQGDPAEIFVPKQEVSSNRTFCEDVETLDGRQEASTRKSKDDFDNTHYNSVFISEEMQESSLPELKPVVKDSFESAKILEETQKTSPKLTIVEDTRNSVFISGETQESSLPELKPVVKDSLESVKISEETQKTAPKLAVVGAAHNSVNTSKRVTCLSKSKVEVKDMLRNISETSQRTSSLKSTIVSKNQNCSSVGISKKSSLLKPSPNVKDTHSKKVCILKKTKKTLAFKSTAKTKHVGNTDSLEETLKASIKSKVNVKDTCDVVNVVPKTCKTSALKTTNLKDTQCNGVNVAPKTCKTSALKAMNVKDTQCNGVNVAPKTCETCALKTKNVKDAQCNGVNVAPKTCKTSALKTTNMKDTQCNGVNVSKKSFGTPVLKSPINLKDTFCNEKNVTKKTFKTAGLKSGKIVKDLYCNGVNVTKKMRGTSALKLKANMKDTHSKKVLNTSVCKSAMKTTHRRNTDEPKKTPRVIVKSTQSLKDIHCNNVGILKKTQKTSMLKSTVKNGCRSLVDDSKKKQRTSMPKLTSVCASDPTVAPNSCDFNPNAMDTPKVSKEKIAQKTKEILKNLNNTIFDSSKQTPKASSVDATSRECSNATGTCDAKPKAEISPTHRGTSSPSGPFLDLWDIKFDSLTQEQRKTLEKLISNYKYHANLLAFSVQMSESKVQVHCKMCGQFFTAEDTEKHLTDQSHLQNIVKKSADNLEARAAISISGAPSMSHPVTLFLDITDVELDSVMPSLRKSLQGLIEKIYYHTNHFSFALKITGAELNVICKICGITPPLENIEEHIKDPKHQRNVFKNCKKNPKTRAAVPEIMTEDWKFLKPTPGELCRCSLCALTIGSDINSWIQHFNSSRHHKKMKEAKELFIPANRPVFKKLFGREMFAVGKRRMAIIRARVTPYTKPQIGTRPKAGMSRSFVVSRWRRSDSVEENTAPNFSGDKTLNSAPDTSQNFACNTVQDSLQSTASNFASDSVSSTSQTLACATVQDSSPNTASNSAPNTSQNFASMQNTASNSAPNISQNFACNTMQNSLKNTAFNSASNTTQNFAYNTAQNALQNTTSEFLQSFSQNLAHGFLQSTQNLVQSLLIPEPINLEEGSFSQIFYSLSTNNQQMVRNIVAQIKNKINDFTLSVKPGSGELVLTCKICRCPMRPENVAIHISDPRHLRMVAQSRANSNAVVVVQESKHPAPGVVQSTSQTLLPEPIHFEQSFYLVFDSLSPKNQQTVRNIVARIKNKISNFELTVEPGSEELRLTCKICRCLIRPEKVEVHLSDPRHLKMVAEQVRSAANQ